MMRMSPRRRLARITRRDRRRRRPALTRRWRGDPLRFVDRRRRLAVAVGALLAAVAGATAGGPVAALVLAVYAALAVHALAGTRVRRGQDRAAATAIEAVGALAAELRAGAGTPATALITSALPDVAAVAAGTTTSGVPASGATTSGVPAFGNPGGVSATAVARVVAALRISEQLGAPLADLLDRVDDDLRAGQRLRASVAAQTAGSQATAVLLAALPVAGLALGITLGADPLRQLLHTPLGAACAVGALALQTAGLGWSSRLVRTAGEVA